MYLVKTKSFELATISRGDTNATKLVIALPGRLDTKDYACFSNHLEYLTDKGFYGISFDPPGTWESPGPIDLFTTTNYIKAVNELIEYYGNKRTFLLGHSRGGTIAMLVGSQNEYVTGFVSIMGSLHMPSTPSETAKKYGVDVSYRDMPPGISKTAERKRFDLPLNYFIDGQRYDALSVLQKCTKPKLLFYGTDDEFTELEQAKKVLATIPEPKMTHELNTNHDYRYHPKVVDEVNKTIGSFITKFGL